MGRTPQLLDQWGRPVERRALARPRPEGSGLAGVRSPLTGYPADGLDPLRLAAILREADQGSPVRFLELAETIEERDPHYLGVLGTRRRSVAQLDITVTPASDAAADVDRADRVRRWLARDELQDELFDILDALGKGYSVTRIDWEVSEGQWEPRRLVRQDPRWFRFDRETLSVPVEIDAQGGERPLEAFRYVFAEMRAKSGLTLRSGLARVAAWGWMFKAYTQRDWAIFSQTYGQPLRVGKYGAGASEEDRDTLFRAVANIAGDCAAIIPDSMLIDFVEPGNLGASASLYRERADWIDQQVSKAVLGQTTTTDAISGGHAVSREHREVAGDIERSDAKALSAIVNRDLVVPWMQLDHGPLPRGGYPRLLIARAEAEDLKALAESVTPFIDRGLRVSEREVRERFGLAEPRPDDALLGPQRAAPAPPADGTAPSGDPDGGLTALPGSGRVAGALHAQALSRARSGDGAEPDPADALADRLSLEADPAVEAMIGQVEAMVRAAGSIEELREMILAGFDAVDDGALAEALGRAFLAAHLGARVALLEGE